MYHYLVGFGVFAHVAFWGLGLAMLAMPAPWRAFWAMLVMPAGFTLQSVVVWAGAYAGCAGTLSYAWASEIIPVALLVSALRRHGVPAWRNGLQKFGGLWILSALILAVLIFPLTRASKGLTTVSLGSCDAGDYAAGARVLLEFTRGDSGGFIGVEEVVRVASVDNFFDFWLRLNHFTPSALIAFNGAIFDCAPYELTSLMTMVLLAGSLLPVFWLARAGLGYRSWMSLVVTGLYGVSPITWYAVAHVAMGQLLAAQGIALLTWSGLSLWRGPIDGRRALLFTGVLALGYCLLLGSYNFILLVALAPTLAHAAGLAVWHREGRRFATWLIALLAPLALSSIIFWERLAGLAERLALFRTHDFGWKIPALDPAGWLGLVVNTSLSPWPTGVRVGLALISLALLAVAIVHGARRGHRGVFTAACLTVPPLLGYGYLQIRGQVMGTNASYDAYKIIAVFYPGLLAALMYWLTLDFRRWRWIVIPFAVVVVALNLRVTHRFIRSLETPPFIVGRELLTLRQLEGRADKSSLNLMIPDLWRRLWANALLLRIPQYFSDHTYEGRNNTPLRGTWDLNGGLVAIRLPDGGSERISAHYSLAHTGSPYFVRAALGEGWYARERIPRTATRWNWSRGDASVRIDNPQRRALRVTCRLNARGVTAHEVEVWLNGRQLHTINLSTALKVEQIPEFLLQSGFNELRLRSRQPPSTPDFTDSRLLAFAVYHIEIEVRPDPAEAIQ